MLREFCEPALCRPNCIDLTPFRVWCRCLLRSLRFLKSFLWINNEAFLLNKSRCPKVCRTLFMHWFVYFVSKRSSSWCANSCKFFSLQRSSAVYGSRAVVEPIHGWRLGYIYPCPWNMLVTNQSGWRIQLPPLSPTSACGQLPVEFCVDVWSVCIASSNQSLPTAATVSLNVAPLLSWQPKLRQQLMLHGLLGSSKSVSAQIRIRLQAASLTTTTRSEVKHLKFIAPEK